MTTVRHHAPCTVLVLLGIIGTARADLAGRIAYLIQTDGLTTARIAVSVREAGSGLPDNNIRGQASRGQAFN